MQKKMAVSLSATLRALEGKEGDFWTFCGKDGRLDAHALFHYPAMMVPQVQGKILDLVQEVFPHAQRVLDPFVGSGTTLVEAMYRGLDFLGVDINPLAGLLSLVKANPINIRKLREAAYRLMSRLATDDFGEYEERFHNQDKWFEPSTIIHLGRITRAITQEADKKIRRVFWVALARCIRRVCNSRLSTYKLHKSPRSEIELRDHNATTSIFSSGLIDVINQLSLFNTRLESLGKLSKGAYTASTKIVIDDSTGFLNQESDKFDVVITSPPYGDNATTVPYGQYSYLPMMWIPLQDIDSMVNPSLLRNTHATDSASLGGSLKDALGRGFALCGRHRSYNQAIGKLADMPNGQKRFAAFAADLHTSVEVLAKRTAKGGTHIWTIGDRSICGHKMPMGELLTEIMHDQGIKLVHTAGRRIVSKKMASRNSISETMSKEKIIIGQMS